MKPSATNPPATPPHVGPGEEFFTVFVSSIKFVSKPKKDEKP